jgi:hypothetical protein
MKYTLKLFDESLEFSENIEDVNNACVYYKTLLTYLRALPEAEYKNEDLYNLLVKQCYNVEQSEVDEPLTPERIQRDTQNIEMRVETLYAVLKERLQARSM